MHLAILTLVFALLMLPGFLGIVLPFPSVPYMFVIAVIFGFVDKFSRLTNHELVILGLLAIASLMVDYLSGVIGAKFSGASKRALYFGMAGFLICTVIFPPFGGIVGLFFGVLIAEILSRRNHSKAFKAAFGSVIGSVLGMLINFFLAVAFITLFLIFVLK